MKNLKVITLTALLIVSVSLTAVSAEESIPATATTTAIFEIVDGIETEVDASSIINTINSKSAKGIIDTYSIYPGCYNHDVRDLMMYVHMPITSSTCKTKMQPLLKCYDCNIVVESGRSYIIYHDLKSESGKWGCQF